MKTRKPDKTPIRKISQLIQHEQKIQHARIQNLEQQFYALHKSLENLKLYFLAALEEALSQLQEQNGMPDEELNGRIAARHREHTEKYKEHLAAQIEAQAKEQNIPIKRDENGDFVLDSDHPLQKFKEEMTEISEDPAFLSPSVAETVFDSEQLFSDVAKDESASELLDDLDDEEISDAESPSST
jgi:hypothetical protein